MPDAARPLADNRLGVMVAQAFPGPGNSGVTALGDPPADYLLGHIEQVVAAGFGAIEVTRLLDPGLRARVRDLVAPLEVTFGAYVTQLVNAEGLHPFDLAHPDEAHRRRAVDRLRICLDEAGELGARRVGVMSGRDPLLFDDDTFYSTALATPATLATRMANNAGLAIATPWCGRSSSSVRTPMQRSR